MTPTIKVHRTINPEADGLYSTCHGQRGGTARWCPVSVDGTVVGHVASCTVHYIDSSTTAWFAVTTDEGTPDDPRGASNLTHERTFYTRREAVAALTTTDTEA